MSPTGQESSRILVIARRAIGDVVLITPLLRLLKERVPAGYLGVLVEENCADVLRHNPHVDEVFVLERTKRAEDRWPTRIRKGLTLIRTIRAKRFDIAVDLFSGPRSAVLARASAAPIRYGEDVRNRGRGFLYTHPIPVERDGRHLVEQKLALIRPLIGEVECSQAWLDLVTTQDERARARELLGRSNGRSSKLIGLIPAAGSVFRRWPASRFAELGDQLFERYGAQIFLFGHQTDVSICRDIFGLMGHKPVDLSGKTTLRELIACLHELDLVIANVTGPMHLAVAVKGPTVIGLYGAADLVQYAPWGEAGTILTKGSKDLAYWRKVDYQHDYEQYLMKITVGDVLDAVKAAEIDRAREGPRHSDGLLSADLRAHRNDGRGPGESTACNPRPSRP